VDIAVSAPPPGLMPEQGDDPEASANAVLRQLARVSSKAVVLVTYDRSISYCRAQGFKAK